MKSRYSRLIELYSGVGRRNGFLFLADKEFEDAVSLKNEEEPLNRDLGYFNIFRHNSLPGDLDFFYSNDNREFCIGMEVPLLSDGKEDERKPVSFNDSLLLKIHSITSFFVGFHRYLGTQGYKVYELTSAVESYSAVYGPTLGKNMFDVKALSTFLDHTHRYLQNF